MQPGSMFNGVHLATCEAHFTSNITPLMCLRFQLFVNFIVVEMVSSCDNYYLIASVFINMKYLSYYYTVLYLTKTW